MHRDKVERKSNKVLIKGGPQLVGLCIIFLLPSTSLKFLTFFFCIDICFIFYCENI